MLLQSHGGELALLPALPDAWKDGSIKGIKARGNFTVDIEWKDGKLVSAKIFSGSGGNCRIRYYEQIKILNVQSQSAKGENTNPLNISYGDVPFIKNQNTELFPAEMFGMGVIDFKTEKGKTYTIIPL
jgi:alpha-L-fucosidase 2